MNSTSQEFKILEWLQLGYPLRSREALRIFGCFRLASRIHSLRVKHGHIEIDKRTVTTEGGKRVAEYFISPRLRRPQ